MPRPDRTRSGQVVPENPGIKTRLLTEMRRRAAAGGIQVLSARGSELERESLRGDRSDGEAAGFAVLHGLYWLTLILGAERPLVLAVDDPAAPAPPRTPPSASSIPHGRAGQPPQGRNRPRQALC